MHRDDWDSVFKNQDKILEQLEPLNNKMFLAGGTGLQRFVLPTAYRNSEDLDFFLEKLCTKTELDEIKNQILDLMSKFPEAKLVNSKWIKDELAWRMFYDFEDNIILDFSYKTRIKEKAQEFGLDENDYIDVVEDNQFIVDEWNRYYK